MLPQNAPLPTTVKPVFFVIGSTGSGKSSAAIKLAHALNQAGFVNTMIINCDVMQFYTALPVATNKATLEEMEGIPHTFLGFLSCHDELLRDPETPFAQASSPRDEPVPPPEAGKRFDVNSFAERASAFIDRYFEGNPGGAIIVCGGTCYYAEALLFANCLTPTNSAADDGPLPGASSASTSLDAHDETLWDALNAIDTVVAQRYHPNDTRRLKRLLEIYETTGELPSDVFAAKQLTLRFGAERTFLLWTFQDSNALFPALDQRVDAMMNRGLIEEVRAFYESIKADKPTTSITGAIGYKEYESVISVGSGPVETERLFAEKVKADTRRYARQQVRWIKNRFVRFLGHAPLPTSHFAQIDATNFHAPPLVEAFVTNRSDDAPEHGVSYPLETTGASSVPVTQDFCELCDMTVCGRDQMPVHLKSKRHRGALKRLAMKRSFEETFGRPLPPPKKSKPQ